MKTNNIPAALQSLAKMIDSDYCAWVAKITLVQESCGADSSDEPFEPSEQDFLDARFSSDEAATLLFVMTQDYCGVPVENVDNITRWIEFNA